MSVYYPTSPSSLSTCSPYSSTSEPTPSLRLTCVNVNHVTYNYLMENPASCATDSGDLFNYSNTSGSALSNYHSFSATQQSRDDCSSGIGNGFRGFSLPSSCESPMSLPTFSPPAPQPFMAHHHHLYQHQPLTAFSNSLLSDGATPATGAGHNLNLEDDFSLELTGAGSSDEGISLVNLKTHSLYNATFQMNHTTEMQFPVNQEKNERHSRNFRSESWKTSLLIRIILLDFVATR